MRIKRAKRNKRIVNFMSGLLLGIMLTIAVLIIFNFKDIKNLFKLPKTHNIINKTNNNNKYEFYKLLPKTKSNISVINSNNKNITKTKKNNYYYIQAEIFDKIHEANELKAKLAFQGFESFVKGITIKGKPCYKVLLGPYKSELIAKNTRKQLNSIGLKQTMIIEIKDKN